ncbi:Fluoroacetyl-CoA thioesterase like protein [Aduncisulcus paluster]|uniref:Fluoroacetyl-CoA thioesterase like protein n=1 Tax=Aduncisulcus paluster TaxID=2918883 RepID=A0ABQ5K0F6_9EUKA|nr:Fluoroacetyl-CoA thioesterase like protein [Aduncisulcus paluster]
MSISLFRAFSSIPEVLEQAGIAIGAQKSMDFKVQKEHTTNRFKIPGMDVLSTPSMLLMMELTAAQLVEDKVPIEKYGSVGYKVNISHLRPTTLGRTVTCEAKLTEIDGKKLKFDVKAMDGDTILGKGSHNRAIIPSPKM